jgi:hypothetical protein
MNTRRFMLAVWLVAFTLNVGYVLAFDRVLEVEGDAAGYDRGAVDLFEGRGFPSGVEEGLEPKREPGMYVFLASVYSVFGYDVRMARICQAVLASTFPLFVFAITRRLSNVAVFPAAAPRVAALLTLICPAFMFYTGVLMRETLLTLLFLASLLVLTGYMSQPRMRKVVLYGALVGLGALVDGRLMYFPVFFAAFWAVTQRSWLPAARFLTVAFVVALIVISPWAIRNYVVLDRFVLLTSQQYKGFWLATNPEGMLEWDWEREPLRSLRDLPPVVRDQEIADLAIENLREYPVRYMGSAVVRFFRLWFSGSHSGVMPLMARSTAAGVEAREWGYVALKLSFISLHYTFVLGGLAGLVVCVRRVGLHPVMPLVTFPAYISVLHMILFATPRYNVPTLPILIIFLSGLLAMVAERTWEGHVWKPGEGVRVG